MAALIGKLHSGTQSGFRKIKRFIKKQTARHARRDGKIRFEDAAPRRTRGWAS